MIKISNEISVKRLGNLSGTKDHMTYDIYKNGVYTGYKVLHVDKHGRQALVNQVNRMVRHLVNRKDKKLNLHIKGNIATYQGPCLACDETCWNEANTQKDLEKFSLVYFCNEECRKEFYKQFSLIFDHAGYKIFATEEEDNGVYVQYDNFIETAPYYTKSVLCILSEFFKSYHSLKKEYDLMVLDNVQSNKLTGDDDEIKCENCGFKHIFKGYSSYKRFECLCGLVFNATRVDGQVKTSEIAMEEPHEIFKLNQELKDQNNSLYQEVKALRETDKTQKRELELINRAFDKADELKIDADVYIHNNRESVKQSVITMIEAVKENPADCGLQVAVILRELAMDFMNIGANAAIQTLRKQKVRQDEEARKSNDKEAVTGV